MIAACPSPEARTPPEGLDGPAMCGLPGLDLASDEVPATRTANLDDPQRLTFHGAPSYPVADQTLNLTPDHPHLHPEAAITGPTRCHDALYSVQALVREDGAVAERYRYDPYGTVTVLNADGGVKADSGYSEFGNPYTFTGRRLDAEFTVKDSETDLPVSQMMYYRNRYYSTDLGRFVGRDPAGYIDSFNLYEIQSVTSFVDPMGLFGFTWDAQYVAGEKKYLQKGGVQLMPVYQDMVQFDFSVYFECKLSKDKEPIVNAYNSGWAKSTALSDGSYKIAAMSGGKVLSTISTGTGKLTTPDPTINVSKTTDNRCLMVTVDGTFERSFDGIQMAAVGKLQSALKGKGTLAVIAKIIGALRTLLQGNTKFQYSARFQDTYKVCCCCILDDEGNETDDLGWYAYRIRKAHQEAFTDKGAVMFKFKYRSIEYKDKKQVCTDNPPYTVGRFGTYFTDGGYEEWKKRWKGQKK